MENSARISVCESEIKNMKGDIAELYIKGDENNKNYNKINLEYTELNLNVKGMTNSINSMVSEIKEDRKIRDEERKSHDGRLVKLENEDGDKAMSILGWLGKNLGTIIGTLLLAYIVFKFGWK